MCHIDRMVDWGMAGYVDQSFLEIQHCVGHIARLPNKWDGSGRIVQYQQDHDCFHYPGGVDADWEDCIDHLMVHID